MPTGTLVHITAARKLMIKISEKTYDSIYNRLYNESKKKNFPTERLAVYSRENDDGEEEHFAMVTPDKYDRQNMPKLEKLLKKDINFSSRMKVYDFMNDDNEQVCGINLELISIHQHVKPKAPNSEIDKIADKAADRAISPKKAELMKKMLAMQRDLDEATRTGQKMTLDFPQIEVSSSDDSDIDEIADKAAARAINPPQLNAEEQAIDEDVEKAVAQLPLPPVLERQTAMSNAATRRRRTPVTATSEELTEVEKQVKYLDDLIAANERAIGADE